MASNAVNGAQTEDLQTDGNAANGHDSDDSTTKSLNNEETDAHGALEGNGHGPTNGDAAKHLMNEHDVQAKDSGKEEPHTNGDDAHGPHGPDDSFETEERSGDEGEEEDGGEDGDEDEDGDEEEEEEEEEEEPVLKYERMGGSTHELLERDSASSLTVSSKLFVRVILCVLMCVLTFVHDVGDGNTQRHHTCSGLHGKADKVVPTPLCVYQ